MAEDRDTMEGRKDGRILSGVLKSRHIRSRAIPQELGLITVKPQITVLKRHRSVFSLGGPIRSIP